MYENGKLARVALFNYVTDANGGNDYTATIRADGLPGNAKVKYLQGGEGGVAAIKDFKYAGQVS